jgi:hydroxymethylbilane synthase
LERYLKPESTIYLATRGSALALAQAGLILEQCRGAFPEWQFELKIIKTTGDKLQTASLAQEGQSLPKGLFTKELETALLAREADIAVHSLKDLPTELPAGLILGAVSKRADVRDVLIYREAGHARGRGFGPGVTLEELPAGAVVATSSPRRKAQLLAANPRLNVPDIRGNVGTRLQKLAEHADLDGTVLALAGLTRLNFRITSKGQLAGDSVPSGLRAVILDTNVMLPCVGQGAIGMEIRAGDDRIAGICRKLDDPATHQCTTAERVFLAAMGGGCQSPVGACAEVNGRDIQMRVVSFVGGTVRHAAGKRPVAEAEALGRELAKQLRV